MSRGDFASLPKTHVQKSAQQITKLQPTFLGSMACGDDDDPDVCGGAVRLESRSAKLYRPSSRNCNEKSLEREKTIVFSLSRLFSLEYLMNILYLTSSHYTFNVKGGFRLTAQDTRAKKCSANYKAAAHFFGEHGMRRRR